MSRRLVLGRPPHQPRGGRRRGTRATSRHDRRGRGGCRCRGDRRRAAAGPLRQHQPSASDCSRARALHRARRGCIRAVSVVPWRARNARTQSSAFPRSPTAPVDSMSRTARTSSSTKPKWVAAPLSTPSSPASYRTDAGAHHAGSSFRRAQSDPFEFARPRTAPSPAPSPTPARRARCRTPRAETRTRRRRHVTRMRHAGRRPKACRRYPD